MNDTERQRRNRAPILEAHSLQRLEDRFALGDRQHDLGKLWFNRIAGSRKNAEDFLLERYEHAAEHLRQVAADDGDPADDHLGAVAWFALTLMHIEHRLDESARTLIRNAAERRRRPQTAEPDDPDQP